MTRQLLFRREVFEARQEGWIGSTTLTAPRAGWVVAGVGVLMVAALILLAAFGHYTQHVTTAGRLVPSRGVLTLNAMGAGSLTSLYVREGQVVSKGEAIAEISGELDSAALGGTYASVSAQLHSQAEHLKNDLSANRSMLLQQENVLGSKIRSLTDQCEEIEGQVVLQNQQIENNQKLLQKMQTLGKKGYISTFQIVEQKGTLFDLRSKLKALRLQYLSTKQQLEEAQSSLAQLPLEEGKKTGGIESKLAGIEQSLAQNEVRRAHVIIAPHDGVIAALMIQEGQSVQEGQPIVVELPSNSKLQAQLFVSSRDIGFIHPGARTSLRFSAFPYEVFGQAHGEVTEVSRSALSPEDVRRLTGKQVNEPQFQIKVSLAGRALGKGSPRERLLPGMAVDASIVLNKRRIIDWIFEPLHDFKWRFE